jgi:hypothetical protein
MLGVDRIEKIHEDGENIAWPNSLESCKAFDAHSHRWLNSGNFENDYCENDDYSGSQQCNEQFYGFYKMFVLYFYQIYLKFEILISGKNSQKIC